MGGKGPLVSGNGVKGFTVRVAYRIPFQGWQSGAGPVCPVPDRQASLAGVGAPREVKSGIVF